MSTVSSGPPVLTGHIVRFSMTSRSPPKLGSLPQQVQSSSAFGCFVAGVCTPLHAIVHRREVQSAWFHCGAPMGAGSVAAYHLWCTPCAWDRASVSTRGYEGSGVITGFLVFCPLLCSMLFGGCEDGVRRGVLVFAGSVANAVQEGCAKCGIFQKLTPLRREGGVGGLLVLVLVLTVRCGVTQVSEHMHALQWPWHVGLRCTTLVRCPQPGTATTTATPATLECSDLALALCLWPTAHRVGRCSRTEATCWCVCWRYGGPSLGKKAAPPLKREGGE